jgi:ankyrin repeat protein
VFEMRVRKPFVIVLCLQLQGETALINASNKGHVEVVKLLLSLPGIDCNHENNLV